MKNHVKISICLFLLFFSTGSFAQFSGGVTAGMSIGSVSVTEIPDNVIHSVEGENFLGFNAGIFAKFDLLPFYIKPELLLYYKRGDLSIKQPDVPAYKQSFSMEKLEIPLLFGFNVLGPVSLQAGPVYNYILGSKNDFIDNSNVTLKKSGLGYRIGAAVDIGRLNLYINYQGIYNTAASSSGEATFKTPDEIRFGVGIALGENSSSR